MHPLGATMSYCNTGYTMLGRVLEVVTDTVWDDLLRTRLVEPLALTHTVTLPEDVLRFRAAIGHIQPPGEELRPAPAWGLPRTAGPAGAICSTAAEVLEFARAPSPGRARPRRHAPPERESCACDAGAAGRGADRRDRRVRGSLGARLVGVHLVRDERSSGTTAARSARQRSCGSFPTRARRLRCSRTAAIRSGSIAISAVSFWPRSPESSFRPSRLHRSHPRQWIPTPLRRSVRPGRSLDRGRLEGGEPRRYPDHHRARLGDDARAGRDAAGGAGSRARSLPRATSGAERSLAAGAVHDAGRRTPLLPRRRQGDAASRLAALRAPDLRVQARDEGLDAERPDVLGIVRVL